MGIDIVCLLTVRYSYCFDSHRQEFHRSETEVGKLENMKRVVIIGRGASGKSTLAVRLGEITGLPVIELGRGLLAARPCRNISRSLGGRPREACRGRGMDYGR
jgi:hypothetical protein